MIDTVSLKTSLIDLAVSGRLSTEFQAKDSVSEIIEKLPTPSSKRRKLLGQVFEYGKQVDIPENWIWMPLGEISSYGDTPVKANTSNVTDNTWILDLEDIKAGGELLIKTRANEKEFAGEKTIFHSGQVLYSKLRPYLKKVLVADEDGISTPELISFDVFGGILPQYMVFCLLDSFTNRAIDKRSYGIKMPRIDAGFMVNLPVPIPPVSEQQYIIERLESAFALIDTIDNLQSEYASNKEALKSKLIDAAIQGKLTEQLPEDGTAEDLYQLVQSEKKKLQKEGKIKKTKAFVSIIDEEIPFQLPSNWKWVRLGSVLNEVIVPQRDKPKRFDGDIPWCRIEDADGDYMSKSHSNQNVSQKTVEEMNLRIFPVGTILSACSGGSIGRILITTTELCTNQTFNGLVCSMGLYNRYLFHFLRNSIGRLKKMGSGAAMEYVSQKKIAEMLIPLPPLAEQHRIVEKLDALLSLVA